MTNRRRVYLARHGAVSYFEPGHDDLGDRDPPLNATGIAQAEAFGQLLAQAPIDLAACTGYQRTRQTTELAVAPRALDIHVFQGLSEAQTGTFEEVESAEQMEAIFVRAFENADQPGARFLTGESYADLWDRVADAWQSLLARVAFVRLVNFTPYNATKLGMHQTTLEMLWQQFVGG